jgi:integrase
MGPDIPQDKKGGSPMTLKEAITLFGYHQRSNLKPRTVRSYQALFQRFEAEFGERSFDSIGSDEIFQFLEKVTGDRSKSTRRLRYAQLKALFNFLMDECNLNRKNPCDAPLLSKAFKTPKQMARRILDREIVEEMIFRNNRCLRMHSRFSILILRIFRGKMVTASKEYSKAPGGNGPQSEFRCYGLRFRIPA